MLAVVDPERAHAVGVGLAALPEPLLDGCRHASTT